MLTPEQTKRLEELNKMIAPYMNSIDPGYGAYLLCQQPEVKKYDTLYKLACLLSRGEYGCHKNDVIGIVEIIQKHMENENEPEEPTLEADDLQEWRIPED